MTLGALVLLILLLVLIGALPTWPHSRSWGRYPSSSIGMILAIVLVVMLI